MIGNTATETRIVTLPANSKPGPQDDQRHQRDARNGIERVDERIEDVFDGLPLRDGDAERDADDDGERHADRERPQALDQAFFSAPLMMSSPVARNIALGGAMKIGSMWRPKYSQMMKNTTTDTVRIALGLSSRSRMRCAGGRLRRGHGCSWR